MQDRQQPPLSVVDADRAAPARPSRRSSPSRGPGDVVDPVRVGTEKTRAGRGPSRKTSSPADVPTARSVPSGLTASDCAGARSGSTSVPTSRPHAPGLGQRSRRSSRPWPGRAPRPREPCGDRLDPVVGQADQVRAAVRRDDDLVASRHGVHVGDAPLHAGDPLGGPRGVAAGPQHDGAVRVAGHVSGRRSRPGRSMPAGHVPMSAGDAPRGSFAGSQTRKLPWAASPTAMRPPGIATAAMAGSSGKSSAPRGSSSRGRLPQALLGLDGGRRRVGALGEQRRELRVARRGRASSCRRAGVTWRCRAGRSRRCAGRTRRSRSRR